MENVQKSSNEVHSEPLQQCSVISSSKRWQYELKTNN